LTQKQAEWLGANWSMISSAHILNGISKQSLIEILIYLIKINNDDVDID